MRTAILVLLSLFALLTANGPLEAAGPDSMALAVVHAGNQFALDLYGQLSKEQPGKNLFFSPVSLSVALSMTAAGARGETEAEMARVLHLTGVLPQAHAEFHKLLRRWNTEEAQDRGYRLRLANRLWGQKDYPFLPSYLALTRQEYGAELRPVDFVSQPEAARQQINSWVEEHTGRKIKDLVPQGALNDQTRLVLTNAIYFKGEWADKFHELLTHDADFFVSADHKVTIRMMSQRERTRRYAEDALLQAIELPYKGDDLSLLVLLPKAVDGLPAVEKSLSAKRIAELQERLQPREFDIFLPKFKLDTSFSLKPTLEALGMKSAFSAEADFSATDGRRDLFVSAVLHKAFVDVNEEGTEAAGASAVDRQSSAGRDFRANHPFVFMICDRHSGGILFLGRLTDPSK